MKKFTKGALITVLIFVVLGCSLCAVGAGIGFHYASIPEMIGEGIFSIGPEDFDRWNNAWNWNDWDVDWKSWNGNTEKYDFTAEQCADIQNLELIMDCGIVEIEETGENEGIQIEVKYRTEKSKRDISINKDGDTLKIEDRGSHKLVYNDNVYVNIKIPADMKFEEIDLQNSAGEIAVNNTLYAKDFSVIVGAGECAINKELQISGKLYAEVDAGEIDFAKISAKKLELNAGVGGITVDKAGADEVVLDCGVGELNVTLEGEEDDYSYSIDCGVGDVEVGGRSYSGLGTTKEVRGGSKTVDIDCGVGQVNVEFAR